MTIYLASVAIPVESIPHLMIEIRQGESAFRVTLSISAAFTSAQIAACGIGSSVPIRVVVGASDTTYTGTVEGFGVRRGYSIVQLKDAVGN